MKKITAAFAVACTLLTVAIATVSSHNAPITSHATAPNDITADACSYQNATTTAAYTSENCKNLLGDVNE
jgi:hypothetical protein